MPRVEPGSLEGRRDWARVHALGAAAHHAPADAGGVDRRAGRGNARGERSTHGAQGEQGVVILGTGRRRSVVRRPTECV